jgi:hypothetical protein
MRGRRHRRTWARGAVLAAALDARRLLCHALRGRVVGAHVVGGVVAAAGRGLRPAALSARPAAAGRVGAALQLRQQGGRGVGRGDPGERQGRQRGEQGRGGAHACRGAHGRGAGGTGLVGAGGRAGGRLKFGSCRRGGGAVAGRPGAPGFGRGRVGCAAGGTAKRRGAGAGPPIGSRASLPVPSQQRRGRRAGPRQAPAGRAHDWERARARRRGASRRGALLPRRRVSRGGHGPGTRPATPRRGGWPRRPAGGVRARRRARACGVRGARRRFRARAGPSHRVPRRCPPIPACLCRRSCPLLAVTHPLHRSPDACPLRAPFPAGRRAASAAEMGSGRAPALVLGLLALAAAVAGQQLAPVLDKTLILTNPAGVSPSGWPAPFWAGGAGGRAPGRAVRGGRCAPAPAAPRRALAPRRRAPAADRAPRARAPRGGRPHTPRGRRPLCRARARPARALPPRSSRPLRPRPAAPAVLTPPPTRPGPRSPPPCSPPSQAGA